MISNAIVIISNWCNLRCPQCLQDAGVKYENELPVDELIKFLDSFPHMKAIKITGGEPFGSPTYTKTYTLAKHAIDKGWKVNINTNGTFSIPNFDLPSDRVSFQISLDGLKEIHDSIRGKDTFDKAVEFIENQKHKGYEIKIMSVIMEQYTAESIERFIKFVCFNFGVRPEFQIVGYVGRNSLKPDIGEDVLSALRRLHCQCRPRLTYCPTIHTVGERVAIDEFGNIIPCPMLGKYKFGTIYDYDETKVKQEMHDKILNCTCAFPNGQER
jgi:MoaA/NifB/PqqE/SkfB family radical SAM enzyme